MDAQIYAGSPRTHCNNEPAWKFTGVDCPATRKVQSKYNFCCAICRCAVALLYNFAYDRRTISALFGAAETLSIWDGAVLPLYFL